jgi:DNA-damage-inducible protein J
MSGVDIRLRVSEEMKAEAEAIFKQMGMSMSEAMRIFLSQCINTGGLPFRPHISIPNDETVRSFKEFEVGKYNTYSLEGFEKALDNLGKK